MTLIFKHNLGSAKMNQHAKYIGQMPVNYKVTVWQYTQTEKQTYTCTGPLMWSANITNT